jgi:glycosyltransferase involved in cell wall biosynthesis
MSRLDVNGRFSTRPVSGVERHAHGILAHLPDARLLVPPRGFRRGAPGHAWEQLLLPRLVHGDAVLWSPCNFGPVKVSRQIVTVHDLAPLDHPEWFGTRYRRWAGTALHRLAESGVHFATVSEFTAERLADHLGLAGDRVTVVGNGVDVARFGSPGADGPDVLGLPERFVLAVASLEPRKNLGALLEAVRIGRERGQFDVPLVVAGALGSARVFGRGAARIEDQLRTAADLGLVQLLGRVDDATLGMLYRQASLMAYVSLYEGFGLPPAEAAACGAKVVVSDIPPLRSLLGDYATYTDPSSAESIADSIAMALERPTPPSPAFDSWETCAERLRKIAKEI